MGSTLILGALLATAGAQEGAGLVYAASVRRPLTVESTADELEVLDPFGRTVHADLFAELQGHDVLADTVRQTRRSRRLLGWGLFSGGAVVFLAGAAGTGSFNEATQERGRWTMLASTGLMGAGAAAVLNRRALSVSAWYSDDQLRNGVDWINAQPIERWTQPHLRVVDDPRRGWRMVDEAGRSWTAHDLGRVIEDPRLGTIYRTDRTELLLGILGCTAGGYLLLVGSTLSIIGATVEPQNGLWVAGTIATTSGALLLSRGVKRLRHQPRRHVSQWYTREEAEAWADWLNATRQPTRRPRVDVNLGLSPIPRGAGVGVQLTW